MKKQILCALSVAALAATMLTVPVYAEDTIIRVEGKDYESDKNWTIHSTNVTPNKWAPGSNNGLNISSGSVAFSETDKPYASYKFNVEKAGIYDLEYAANYLKDGSKVYLSPFSVTVNDDEIMFAGDTPNNSAMTAYTQLSGTQSDYGKYNVPVYLEAGENTIKFTIEGGRYNGGKDYVFYLDYFQFTYNDTATTSETIQVEAEDLIAGNVPSSNGIAKLIPTDSNTTNSAAAKLASNQTMYQFNAFNNAGGYLEYIVPSATEGDFNLEITGSNTDKTTGLKSWCGDFNVVIGDTTISVGEDVTSVHKADVYDIMTANQTVKLKQGLNKIRVELDKPDKNGRYLIHLDYLKFTPVEVPEVQDQFESFGGTYEPGSDTAEFTATGLTLKDASKLVFGITDDKGKTYKYVDNLTELTGDGSANLAVQLTGIPETVSEIKLGVADFDVKEVE